MSKYTTQEGFRILLNRLGIPLTDLISFGAVVGPDGCLVCDRDSSDPNLMAILQALGKQQQQSTASNRSEEFAQNLNQNAVKTELPAPTVGQFWQHRNGFTYEILETDIEAAGQLRHQNPTGYFHLYRCTQSWKKYLRLTDLWEHESQQFKLIHESTELIAKRICRGPARGFSDSSRD